MKLQKNKLLSFFYLVFWALQIHIFVLVSNYESWKLLKNNDIWDLGAGALRMHQMNVGYTPEIKNPTFQLPLISFQ